MARPHDRKTTLLQRIDRSAIAKTLGYSLGEVGEGWATTRMTAEEKHIHEGGIVQGGVLVALADAALTAALFTTVNSDEDAMITEMKVNFMRPTWPGGSLEARATVTYRGKRVAFAEVDIVNQEGKSVAKLLGSAIYRPALAGGDTQQGS